MPPSSLVTNALLDTLRNSGYNVGTAMFIRLDRRGEFVAHVDATDSKTGERWIVHAPTEYDAVVEVVRQIGFDLEE